MIRHQFINSRDGTAGIVLGKNGSAVRIKNCQVIFGSADQNIFSVKRRDEFLNRQTEMGIRQFGLPDLFQTGADAAQV
jgi:hypothetical protein